MGACIITARSSLCALLHGLDGCPLVLWEAAPPCAHDGAQQALKWQRCFFFYIGFLEGNYDCVLCVAYRAIGDIPTLLLFIYLLSLIIAHECVENCLYVV